MTIADILGKAWDEATLYKSSFMLMTGWPKKEFWDHREDAFDDTFPWHDLHYLEYLEI